MKFLYLLKNYFKGIRTISIVLSMAMLIAMLLTVLAAGDLLSERTRIDALEATSAEDIILYQFVRTGVSGGILPSLNKEEKQAFIKATISNLRADSRVEKVFPVIKIKLVSHENESINLRLYHPEMMDYFTGMKKQGMNFDEDPNGCIIVGYANMLGDYQKGDDFTLKIPGVGELTVPVLNNYLGYHFEMTDVSNFGYTDHRLTKDDAVIMLATDSLLEKIFAMDDEIEKLVVEYEPCFFVLHKPGLDTHEFSLVRKDCAMPYYYYFLPTAEDMVQKCESQFAIDIKEELPQPLFLLSASLVAYIGIVVLIIRKKQKDLAMFYLCGGSPKTCIAISLLCFQLIVLIPVLLITAFIMCWEILDLGEKIYRAYYNYKVTSTKNGEFFLDVAQKIPGAWGAIVQGAASTLANYLQTAHSIRIDGGALWIVFVFYGITALVAFLVTWLSMRKHSPLTYLRGVNE